MKSTYTQIIHWHGMNGVSVDEIWHHEAGISGPPETQAEMWVRMAAEEVARKHTNWVEE